jgi:hypothetical protein
MSFLTPFYLWQLDQSINEKGKGKSKPLNTLAETETATKGLFDHLEPMDVILIDEQKRDVAGKKDRFDHAVIYLGSYHGIKAHDLASHPAIDMYGNSLRRGYTFLELAGGGIKLWSLDEILQVNEIVLIRYAKGRASDNLSQINSVTEDGDNQENDSEDIEVKTDEGWDRAAGSVIQDKSYGNLSGALEKSGQWTVFSQKEMQRRALLLHTLDLMLKPGFVNPPVLSDPERSSLLMSAVFGMDELGVTLRSGQNMPSLTQMLTAAVVINDVAEIPFVVLNGEVHSGGRAKLFLIQDFSNRK